MKHQQPAANLRPVLVVEDSDEDFNTVVEAAARARVGNRLVHAVDADSAQRLLAGDAVGDTAGETAGNTAGGFAFMLLDQNLPGTDGLSFLKQLRLDPLLSRLPTVILTTSGNPRDRDAFYDAGANAYHVKAVHYLDCLRTLEEIFGYWLNSTTLPDMTPLGSAAAARQREGKR